MAENDLKRLIDGHYASDKNIIARCHFMAHRGHLTERLMEEHDCIAKKCVFFEKAKPKYWTVLETQAEKNRAIRAEMRLSMKKGGARDAIIRATLEDSGCVHVTSIKKGNRKRLVISYIYDKRIDLAPEVKFLQEKLKRTVKLKACAGTDEAIEKLIRKPRRGTRKVTDLRKAPKVGNATKKRLAALGVFCLEDLYGRYGDKLYESDCQISGGTVNKRFLTAYRSAAKYANTMNVNLYRQYGRLRQDTE